MAEHAAEEFEACAICARTILRGERVSEYVAGDGELRRVCSLCKARAEASGWIPAEQAATRVRPAQRRRRGIALRAALTRAAERVRTPGSIEGADDEATAEAAPELELPPEPEVEPEPEPAPAALAAEPVEAVPAHAEDAPAPTAEPKPKPKPKPKRTTSNGAKKPARSRRSAVERRMHRAVERFNESEQARVVGGLIRSLGQPHASVQSVSAKPPRVAITVAWELSWYRWEVSDDGEGVTVREVAKGDEVDELTEAAKRWNATVDDDGTVRLTAPQKKPSAAKAPE